MRTGWDDGYSIQLFPGHSWHWLSLTIRSAHQRPLPSHVEARGCQRRGDLAGRCPLAGHSGSISPGRGEAWLSLESPGARSFLGPSPGVPPRLLRPCGGLHPGAGEGGLGDRRCEVTGASWRPGQGCWQVEGCAGQLRVTAGLGEPALSPPGNVRPARGRNAPTDLPAVTLGKACVWAWGAAGSGRPVGSLQTHAPTPDTRDYVVCFVFELLWQETEKNGERQAAEKEGEAGGKDLQSVEGGGGEGG